MELSDPRANEEEKESKDPSIIPCGRTERIQTSPEIKQAQIRKELRIVWLHV